MSAEAEPQNRSQLELLMPTFDQFGAKYNIKWREEGIDGAAEG